MKPQRLMKYIWYLYIVYIDLKANRLHNLSIKDKLIYNYLNYYSAGCYNENCFNIIIVYT